MLCFTLILNKSINLELIRRFYKSFLFKLFKVNFIVFFFQKSSVKGGTECERLLTHIENNRGPSAVPWGTS